MKVLVLGGGGQLAKAVLATAPVHYDVVSKTRALLDIREGTAVERAVKDSKPDWVINCAAYTAVDRAEDEPERAIAANDTAVRGVVAATAEAGIRLLHLSTDFVFDGNSSRAYLPTDQVNPLNVYGITKRAGEEHVLRNAGRNIVLRTSWLYASTGRNFVRTMLKLMSENPEIRVVCDQIGAPTWANSAALAIWAIIKADLHGGIYHWADLGVASWYDFAVAIQEEALDRGILGGAIPIRPIQSAEYATRARRPAFSVLDTVFTRAALEIGAHHWRYNLRMMLDEFRAA